ncbi:CBM96 family carbohydrate-binding protein [Flavobacterium sp. WC2509]|uniref:CBM96 family carbohydrate-binding protein n=1 Tax=Flavobacterium sp. WC2509 TaxID=3461406 RepID=UPI0040444656
MLLILISFIPKAFATDFYTASATATLAGNTGAVNVNWTTNPDGLTGLTTVAIAATDNLIILNGGTATITASMIIGALTINQGGAIIHNNNATATSFTINGLLTWNGNIRTLQAVSGSNFFNANGDVMGYTAVHDSASTRGVYMGGDGLRTISLTQVAGVTNTGSAGIQLSKSHILVGNCTWYSPLIFGGGPTPATVLDLNGYNLQVSSIQAGNSTRLLKCNPNSNLSLSGGQQATTLFLDPSASTLNKLTIDPSMTPTSSGAAINITGNLAVNTLYFGIASGGTLTRYVTVNGDVALANNGTMRFQTKGTTAGSSYDQLKATGNITIGASAILQVDLINSYVPPVGSIFNFAQSTGTGTAITGNFTTIKDPKDFVSLVSYLSGNTLQYKIDSKICSFTLTPDLPLIPSNPAIDAEIELAFKQYSDSYLASAPTSTALNTAIASYNALGITVNGNTITASTSVTSYNQVSFLKTFAQQVKFHPEDTDTFNKALNTVWLVSDRICKGTMGLDGTGYAFVDFGQAAVLIPGIKDNTLVKSLFENVLYQQQTFSYIWEPNRISKADVGVDMDVIGNCGGAMLGYAKWIDNSDERYRYMTGFKRMMEKYTNYTAATYDGLKPDGSSFHHWAGYPSYAGYDLNIPANITYYLRQTSFQISTAGYLRLRDALMAQLMFGNDKTVRSISMGGRKPYEYKTVLNQYSYRNMAMAGGSILGTGSSDPVMATLHNRLWGGYGPLGNSTVAPFNSGYFQFNHSMTGIYRKDNWVATCKGFSNNMFGTETYTAFNRYGRYQSYGAVDIIYEGDNPTENGYDETTRDWNFVPGTTVIRLPWDKLQAENETQDELQQKRFVGSLSFVNKNNSYLKAIQGTYGMFAMDFQQKTGQGWGANYTGENHNATFVFKKSVFTFDNMLICLGSNIGNNDGTNTTLTTLYQRKASTGKDQVTVDSNPLSTGTYDNTYADTNNHWIVDNFSTGFYVISGSGTIKLTKADQQTPQHDKLLTQQTISANPVGNYAIGYIDHGTAPSNKGYEYVCIPKATATDMTTLDSQITAGNKPYTVHRKDDIAHIVEYKPTAAANSIFGYAFFSALSGINNSGQLTSADFPCLVMSQYDSTQKSLKIAVNNPDLGFSYRDNIPSVDKQINIKIKGTNWEISQPNSRAAITGTANGETTIQFTVVDGLPVEITLARVLAPQTITFNVIPTKRSNDPAFNLTATASSGLAVNYISSNTAVAAISGTTVTIVGEGTSTITASQEGNDIYGAATAVEQVLTVNKIIAPVADSYVRDGSYAANNYGTATGMLIKKDLTSYSREVYLKFDLNGVNSFDNATLRLNINIANTTPNATTWQVYYVPTDTWTETGINWNNKPASTTLLATINGQSSGWAEWNISSQALAELAADKTLSLRIVSTVVNSTSEVTFNSKEVSDTTLRPQLALTSNSSQTGRISSKVVLIDKSIEPENKNTTVQMYPNPVKDILHIDFAGYTGDTEGYVFDMQGRMILNKKMNESDTTIDVSKLSAGTYVVKINAGSEEIITKKIVKM